MTLNISTKLRAIFFFIVLSIGASAQNSNDTITIEPSGERVIFDIEYTNPRFMDRQFSKYNIDLSNVWMLLDSNFNSEMEKDRKPRSPIFLGLILSKNLTEFYGPDVKSYTKMFPCYRLANGINATIIALGITSENIQDFKYHVVENDSIEIVPWSPIPRIEKNYGLENEFKKRFKRNSPFMEVNSYANLGTFNSTENQLLIEVVNNKDYSVRDGIILDWKKNLKPIVTQIIAASDKAYFNLNFTTVNRNYVTDFDPLTGMPTNLSFPVDSIKRFSFAFKNHVTVPYKMYLIKNVENETITTQIDYYFLDEQYNFDSKYYNVPGEYELVIEPVITGGGNLGEDQKLSFKFKVLPPPTRSYSFMEIASFAIAVLLLLTFAFSIYYLLNKRKLKKARQQKEFVNLKLKSIQSQLNPHFMFNALSSIQNLMNKNDIEGANHYLGKFSGLTRKVLDSSEDEMVSLEDELIILEDYIQMEQLRFGFLYEIELDNQINAVNVEVPTMLLQPFVENAVKHGVSALNKEGIIKISVNQNNNDLVLQVADNGRGFQEKSINGNSKGIKLVKERINLLNQTFKGQVIELKISPGEKGTSIILKLKNWL